jgi:hypothetical protein
MKCVCGYKGKDFKLVECVEVYEPDADVEQTNGEYSQVYACPKCGTLKIEVKK